MSQIATSRAFGSWATMLASYVPRPPAPISPTFTAEFAAVPRTVWKGTSAADTIRLRLRRSDTFGLPFTAFFQHCHEFPDIEVIIVPCAPTDHISVAHA